MKASGPAVDRGKAPMNSRRNIALAALASLFAAGGVLAQQGPPARPEEGGRPPHPPIEMALDANDDGHIDATEIANAPAALKKLDKNGDGRLTSDEYFPPRPGGPGGPGGSAGPEAGPGGSGSPRPRRTNPLVAAIDLDGDGILSAVERAQAPASLKKLDKNGDGKLSPDEYRPPRPGTPPATSGPTGTPRPQG